MTQFLTKATPGTLADKRHELIESWARELGRHPQLNVLTMQQRRVVASLWWKREVAVSNEHMGVTIPPHPILGMDDNNRPVVQGLDLGQVRAWALTKSGDPADVKTPVKSLKDGRVMSVPGYVQQYQR
jgi:hypothetical protein